ncbi:MAG: FKBP-type peptidyl-prolyl cis-trans isomerase [Acidobacteria bacterium]|nr:FKBP-type peptidyl-prolyl cis-trans isomerase [Acidobacteriota bacterium]
MQFEDIEVGSGQRPLFNQTVRVRYTGRYTDGAKFDSNEDSMSPVFEFRLGAGQVIKGWDIGIGGGQGIPPMRVGGRRKLIVPPSLGYGELGRGAIPPNATLVFEVSLVGVR